MTLNFRVKRHLWRSAPGSERLTQILLILSLSELRYFTGEVSGTVALPAVDGRSGDWFSIGGDTPAVAGGIVTLLISVAAIRATARYVHIVSYRVFVNSQTSLFHAPTTHRPLYIDNKLHVDNYTDVGKNSN